MSTKFFSPLAQRIDDLMGHYLPAMQNELGEYTPRQQDDAIAFILLAHAALESYLEDLATEACDVLVKRIELNSYDELTSAFLIRTAKYDDVKAIAPLEVAKAGRGKHKRLVSGNNGIKEQDFNKLLSPLGFDFASMATELSTEISLFGSKRGGFAHRSVEAGIRREVNPYEERLAMKGLLTHLAEFDSAILALMPELAEYSVD